VLSTIWKYGASTLKQFDSLLISRDNGYRLQHLNRRGDAFPWEVGSVGWMQGVLMVQIALSIFIRQRRLSLSSRLPMAQLSHGHFFGGGVFVKMEI